MWKRLEKWQGNLAVKMTKERYLTMMEQMGEEPNPDKCPPDIEDFPLILQQAMDTYNRLGDRVYPDIGYMGKDYTALPLYLEINKIENKELFLEALVRLDEYTIKKSAEQLKRARDAAKKKGNVQ